MVNGWLQYAHPDNLYRDEQGNPEVPWVNSGSERQYTIANAPSDGWEVIDRSGYRQWLSPAGHIYVLKMSGRSDEGQ